MVVKDVMVENVMVVQDVMVENVMVTSEKRLPHCIKLSQLW